MIKYTRAQLMTLPIHRLRNLDISTIEEEKMVQEVVNLRVRTAPVKEQIFRRDIPDIKTKEEEEKWQAIVDQRYDELKDKRTADTDENIGDPFSEPIGDPVPQLDAIGTLPEAPVAVLKTFCDSCDSKGVRHKKICPKAK